MKARLLTKWGGYFAGQVLSNVTPDSIPGDVAEWFEDHEPVVPLTVVNDQIDRDEAQRVRAKASKPAAAPEPPRPDVSKKK